MISTRSGVLVIDTVVCLTLAKWETVSGRFGGYLTRQPRGKSGNLVITYTPKWESKVFELIWVSLKRGLYAGKAIKKRRQLRDLWQQSRELFRKVKLTVV
jgi:hypothetical protein